MRKRHRGFAHGKGVPSAGKSSWGSAGRPGASSCSLTAAPPGLKPGKGSPGATGEVLALLGPAGGLGHPHQSWANSRGTDRSEELGRHHPLRRRSTTARKTQLLSLPFPPGPHRCPPAPADPREPPGSFRVGGKHPPEPNPPQSLGHPQRTPAASASLRILSRSCSCSRGPAFIYHMLLPTLLVRQSYSSPRQLSCLCAALAPSVSRVVVN